VLTGYTKRTEGSQEVYDVTFKTPDIFPLVCILYYTFTNASVLIDFRLQFKFAQNPTTRERASQAYESRLAINAPLFVKAIDLRHQIAKLLQYPTWADYVTEEKMIKNAQSVVKVDAPLRISSSPLLI
jgi:Zn-dependent oligopeptidase